MMVTVIAAVLAVVLTLVLATSLSDLVSTRVSSTRVSTGARTPPALQTSPASNEWNASPFAPLLSSPPAVRWLPTRR
jgi:hypothetical protein